jgi:hypothetical protein
MCIMYGNLIVIKLSFTLPRHLHVAVVELNRHMSITENDRLNTFHVLTCVTSYLLVLYVMIKLITVI